MLKQNLITMTDEGKKIIGLNPDYIDRSADPRKDMYRFANGRWMDTAEIPKDMTSINAFVELDELNKDRLRRIAEECAAEKDGRNRHEKLVGDFYLSATNTDKLEELRFKPIEDDWKLVEGIDSRENLAHAISELHMRGVGGFFYVLASPDNKNSSVYALYLQQSGLSLPDREYYLNGKMAEIRDYYLQHMERMFGMYGIAADKAEDMAKAVLEIETVIAKASWPNEQLMDDIKNYNPMDIEALCKRYGSLYFADYLKRFEAQQVPYVIVGQPDFFDEISRIVAEEDIGKLKAYLSWKVINGYASLLHKEADDEHFDMFGRKLSGQKEQKQRWKRAVGAINSCIGDSIGRIYVERYFDAESKALIEQMVADLINVFRKRILALEWMGEETKRKAVEKLDRMVVMVGYPKKFREYDGLVTDPDDYAGNVKRAYRAELLRDMHRLGKPVDKDEWFMNPQDVNAYNSPPDNRIVFPAGILQAPFFDKGVDHAVNYGSIGSTIGHEMTHGFDSTGRTHDADGNLRDWWTAEDEKKFNELAEEVVKEFSSIEILPGMKINGRLTLGENLADMGGLNIAYDALMERLASGVSDRHKIDGFTVEQRFFIAYAQSWKNKISDESAMRRLLTDPHSPERIRAMVPSVNNPAFDIAFPPDASAAKEKRKLIGVW